jgi:protein phosphatase 2C
MKIEKRWNCMQVSALCRDRMHELMPEELMREGASFLVRREHATAGVGTSAAASGGASWVEQAEEERAWRAALGRAFRRVDALAVLPCGCGRAALPRCSCPLSINTGFVGSTAVVALLVRCLLLVANCGDSRAVLCRGPAGTPPVPLSDDHKVRIYIRDRRL